MIDKNDLFLHLNNVKTATKDNYVCDCPYCGKSNHFYINSKTFLWDCKKCGEYGNIFKLVHHLHIPLILEKKNLSIYTVDYSLKQEDKIEEKLDFNLEKRELPIGFERIYDDTYLKSRYFTDYDFFRFCIGKTSLKKKFKDYIIFSIEYKNNVVGYICRNLLNDDRLRYVNSKNDDFNKIMYGMNEIDSSVKTVILVEGIFDKIRIDNLYQLPFHREIKCLSIFGKKISKYHIEFLKNNKVSEIILLLDKDAVDDSKSQISNIINSGFDFKIGYLLNKDASASTDKELDQVFDNLHTPFSFFYEKVSIKDLRV